MRQSSAAGTVRCRSAHTSIFTDCTTEHHDGSEATEEDETDDREERGGKERKTVVRHTAGEERMSRRVVWSTDETASASEVLR